MTRCSHVKSVNILASCESYILKLTKQTENEAEMCRFNKSGIVIKKAQANAKIERNLFRRGS